MELRILLGIFALLVFGMRRNGRPRSRAGLALGVLLLPVLSLAFGLGSIWNRLLEGFAGRRRTEGCANDWIDRNT